MSRDKLVELVHGYADFPHMRTALEQMAEGAHSNADFAKWAAKLIQTEREDRRGLKVSRRLRTVGWCRERQGADYDLATIRSHGRDDASASQFARRLGWLSG